MKRPARPTGWQPPARGRTPRAGIGPALAVPLALILAAASPAAGDPEGVSFFEVKIRPVLAEHCYRCHSARAPRPKAGLRLDTRAGLVRGGDSGPAVEPGRPDDSPLIGAIEHADEAAPMPPGGKLPVAVIADFRKWVAMGAPGPRDGDASAPPGPADGAPPWWSLRPLGRPPVPAIDPEPAPWARTPVDAFILAGLRDGGLEPAPEADRRTLIRRLSFDLIGLPPTPEDVEAFLADEAPDAYERLVDRLLASPHFGERRARLWMDVVHFAETHGHDQDRIRPHAWPYRDYLIASFNRDTPYARFVREQIAADVLFPDEPRLTVALGFLAAGPWDESSLRDIREDSLDRQVGRTLDRDDMVTTTMSTFVSSTVHCARCHDHKFDPIPQEDYYGLQAVFAGVDRADRSYDPDPAVRRLRRELTARLGALGGRNPTLMASLLEPELQAEVAAWEAKRPGTPPPPDAIARILAAPAASRSPEQRQELAAHYLSNSLTQRLAALPPPRLVYAAAADFAPDGSHKPAGGPRPVHLLRRGDIRNPGPLAEARALSCVGWLPARFVLSDPADEGARRAALAQWIADPGNPLTWRSIVNRVWQDHFGRGLVDTPNDFGRMGSPPSHPELLDWLAAEFRDGGGSLKRLHRLLVTSAVYRQATRHDPRAAAVDAGNRRLWRQNRRKLDAESVRDAILQVSGRLDRTMGGPSVQQFHLGPGVHVTPVVDYTRYVWDGPGAGRRAVYRFLFRTLPDPFLDALDAADASQLTPVRTESISPVQALALLNNRFVLRHSEHFARRIDAPGGDPEASARAAYRLALGRPPTAEEARELASYAAEHGLANACRLLFNSSEFLFVN